MPSLREQLCLNILSKAGVSLASPEFVQALLPAPREKIVTGGWRAGKSSEAAAEMMLDLMESMWAGSKETFLGWIVGPDYPQARNEYRYIKDWLTTLGGGVGKELIIDSTAEPKEGQWVLEGRIMAIRAGWKDGDPDPRYWLHFTIETKSAQHTERLASVAPDSIVVVEAGQCSDEVRTMMIGRAMEKRARITYTGTLEDEENHERWAWYSELAAKWKEEPDPDHQAYSLPSWANLTIYPQGAEDPEILKARAEFDEFTFGRRIAGEPMGLQFQVYPELNYKNLCQPCPPGLQFYTSTGGMDYGTVHPSTLVVIQWVRDLGGPPGEPPGVGWVREAWINDGPNPGDTQLLQAQKYRLSRKYNCWRWGVDPNQTYAAKNDAWSTAVKGSADSRAFRIGLTKTRLQWDKLYFDLDGPNVKRLVEEMLHIHRYKDRQGQLVLRRDKDDMTAALEDAIEVMDGPVQAVAPLGGKMKGIPSPVRKYRRIHG